MIQPILKLLREFLELFTAISILVNSLLLAFCCRIYTFVPKEVVGFIRQPDHLIQSAYFSLSSDALS